MSERVDGNAAIELHDSTLQRVDQEGRRLCAILSAYVHRSAGTPGRSNGSGWSQTAHLHLEGGTASAQVESAIRLKAGRVDLDGEILDNLLPLPLAFYGSVRVELEGSESERLVLVGRSLTVTLQQDAKYIEEFPGE